MKSTDASISIRKSNAFGMQKLVMVFVLIFFIILLSFVSESFLTVYNISNIIRQTSFAIITGCAALLLVVSGNIDLSVGSVVSLTTVLFAMMCKVGISIWLAALISMMAGASVGLINSIVAIRFSIPSIIATLGTMNVVRGLSYTICSAHPVEGPFKVEDFSLLGRGTLFDIIPVPLIIFIVIIAVFIFLEKKTVLGKFAIAIGGNKTAAYLSGINTNRIQAVLFILTGAMAGLSGAVMSSRLGAGDPTVGQGFELDVMTAVILGGANINGGEGTVIGTVIGALIVGVLNNGMNMLGIQSFYQYVVKGAVLLLALTIDILMRSRMNKKLTVA